MQGRKSYLFIYFDFNNVKVSDFASTLGMNTFDLWVWFGRLCSEKVFILIRSFGRFFSTHLAFHFPIGGQFANSGFQTLTFPFFVYNWQSEKDNKLEKLVLWVCLIRCWRWKLKTDKNVLLVSGTIQSRWNIHRTSLFIYNVTFLLLINDD